MHDTLNSYAFGQALVGLLAFAVVFVAAVLSPSPEALSFFGQDIPILCSFRRITGYGCPGCGLTRSFVFMAHFRPLEAFQMNYMGPVLFLGFAFQIPYRLFTVWRGNPRKMGKR